MTEYLMNCWYQAGWSHEIDSAGLSRILLGRRTLFWRLENGSVTAMEDRCPHRFAPLSRGEIKGDTVTCIYHGLAFGADGKCLHGLMPEPVPANVRVRTFPVVERDAILWFWPGDAEAADESLIPDFSFLREVDGFKRSFGHEHVKANYQLIADNLMDTTHIELVHRNSFAAPGVIPKGHFNLTPDGNVLFNNFWIDGMTPAQVWPEPVAPAESYDRWIDMRWDAPATMRLNVGTAPHGTVPEAGVHVDYPGILQSHILTPETPTTTHYFWALQDRLVGTRDHAGALGPILERAFGQEDKPLLEAVQDNMRGTDFWAEGPAFLNSDRGALTARRMLEKLIRRERQDAPAEPDLPHVAVDA